MSGVQEPGASTPLPADPLVSVIVLAYRHERFITQAIDSVLGQQAGFPVEILISEDCSPDRTRELVIAMQRQHPATIRLFFSERNQNDNEVITRAWHCARGRYVAILDGDDYWTDPGKLQKQVAFMDRHPDVFICGHAVTTVDEHGGTMPDAGGYRITEDRYLSREDLAAGYCFPVVSALFRNNRAVPPFDLFNDVYNADSFLYAYFANFGGGYVSRDVMGAYRVHPGGAWSGLDSLQATDHRNATLWRIPRALDGSLRCIAYAACLAHALWDDYSWPRRIRQIPYAALMTMACMTPRAALYLTKRAWLRLAGRR